MAGIIEPSAGGPASEAVYADWAQFARQSRLPAGALLALAALVFALKSLGLATEDLQTFLFPLFLVAFLVFFRRLQFRIPAAAVLLLTGVWAFNALHVRGYLATAGHSAYFARLENDPTGLVGRGAMLRINHIADTYGLSTSEPVQRRFSSLSAAGQWLAAQLGAPAVVTGSSSSFSVLVTPRIDKAAESMLTRFRRAVPGGVEDISSLERSYGLDPASAGVQVTFPGSSQPLIVLLSPEVIPVPGEPVEMNRHYLAWLLNGLLRVTEADSTEAIRQLGLRKKELVPEIARLPAAIDSFSEAALIVGDWPNPSPLIAARFFLASMLLIESVDGRFEEAPLKLADDTFRSAAGFTRGQAKDALTAALWNNHAVARLMRWNDDDSREARRWLERAAAVTDETGKPVRGARAAMINLILLDRAGL